MALTATFLADLTRFDSAIKNSASELKTFDRTTATTVGSVRGHISGLVTSLLPVASATAAAALAFRAFKEVMTSGAQLAAVSQGFQALAGSAANASATLRAMQVGTRGLVTDLDIMQASNKAMLLGLGLNAKGMGDLAKTAQVLGRAMGQNATKSLDDLITALGRSSPLILDNLGLTVKVGEANERYAAQLGKVVSQLTDAESKQAFMNAAMAAANQRVTELGDTTLTLSDRFAQLKIDVTNSTAAFGALIQTSPALNTMMDDLIDAIQIGLPRALLEGQIQLFEFAASMARLAEYIPSLGNALGKSAETTKFFEDELRRAKDVLEGFDLQWQKLGQTTRTAATPIAAAGAAAVKSAQDTAKATTKSAEDRTRALRDFYNWVGQREMEAYEATRQRLAAEFQLYKEHFARVKETLIELVNTFDPSLFIEPLRGAVAQSPAMWASAWAPMRDGFKNVLESLPQTLQNAFTGGGGIMGALKAIGVQIANVLAGSISEAITKALAGRAAGSLIGGGAAGGSSDGPSASSIGKYAAYATVIGAAAYGIFKIVQHNRHLNDEVKAANVEIETLRVGLIEAYGPLARLEQQAQALGLSFVSAWGAQGQGGLKAFNEYIKEFERRLVVANEKFAPLLQSATELGVRLPESLLLSIQALRDMGILTEGNAALLDRLAGAAEVDWRKMSELAQKYGIDIASLDRSFQQARLGANAKDLIEAFTLLTHGKPENQGAVLFGLSDEIQALIDESRQFGTTIPENMRPWIEELRRAGLLTGDLADIHFGEAVKSEIELITEALRELVATLNLVAAGLGGLPTPPTGGGGPGGGGYIDFDSPVPERAIAFSRSGGSGGPQTIVVQVPLDGRVVTEVVLDRMGNRYALRGG